MKLPSIKFKLVFSDSDPDDDDDFDIDDDEIVLLLTISDSITILSFIAGLTVLFFFINP